MVGKTNRNGKDEEEGRGVRGPSAGVPGQAEQEGEATKASPGNREGPVQAARKAEEPRGYLGRQDWKIRSRPGLHGLAYQGEGPVDVRDLFALLRERALGWPAEDVEGSVLFVLALGQGSRPAGAREAAVEPSLVPRGQPPRRAGLLARFLGHDGPGVELCGPAQARQVHELGPHVRPRLP